MTELQKMGKAAKEAEKTLALCGTELKNRALLAIASKLEDSAAGLLDANRLDLEEAKKNGMSAALLDRLMLTEERIRGIASGIRQIAALPDPVGEILSTDVRPNGLRIVEKRVPLGVVGMIFEARPNVIFDAAALSLKAGNCSILRGGKEAIHSNIYSEALMREALSSCGLPKDCIQLVKNTDRSSASELMNLREYLDVLIPRGGAGLIRTVAENSRVPVIVTGEGICHVYIDRKADLKLGARVLENAKCSRPSVCNAAECVLIHREVLEDFLKEALLLLSGKKVELRADEEALAALRSITGLSESGAPAEEKLPYTGRILAASEEDWDTEYGDYILAIRTVGSCEEAMDFIREHGTMHSECIITEDAGTAEAFLAGVDAAAVYVNASTRFTDGGEFGMGAEIGISTQKLHVRGPMGLKALTSTKYLVYGDGQVR